MWCNFYPRLDRKDFRLVLVHSGPYLLPQIGEELGRYCGNQLEKRGIEVRLDTRVTAITAERAILSTGDVIEANTVVTTVGNATHPVIKKLIDRYQLANAKGRLVTEPTLQVRGHEKLWAAGKTVRQCRCPTEEPYRRLGNSQFGRARFWGRILTL